MKRKFIINWIVFFTLFSLNSYGESFADFLKNQQNSYDQYKDQIEKEFESYKKAYEESYKEYTAEIQKKWPIPEVSTKHKWVEYSKDYNSKKSIDYEKQNISIEVIANSEKEAQEQIGKIFDKMVQYSVEDGVKNDLLENKIAKKINIPVEQKKNEQKLIADVLTKKEQQQIRKNLVTQKVVKEKYNGKFIYKVNVKLPSNTIVKKAKEYQSKVQQQAQKTQIPQELIYAIMHSESSFNPMARSHIPAFGLMQIVPSSAGIDTYYHLYGKKKVLSSQYLYNAKNNILIGSNYLHILYFKYLRKIENPQSRLYCAIAAYNTGAGNVAKAFSGSTNINKAANLINKMSSDQVYKTLMKKLPYNETKNYLVKVNDRFNGYNKLIKSGQL